MRWVVTAAVVAFVVIGVLHQPARSKPPAAPETPLRYTDVEPIFVEHCAACHDARLANKPGPQAVFEMSSYPFSTKRPATLLDELRHMFEIRGALSADEKAKGVAWIAGGALDANGQSPRWR